MSELTFNYGGQEITVHKSKNQVAVKRQPGTAKKATEEGATPETRMGSFDLITTKRKGEKTVQRALDKLRAEDEVLIGTHVYNFDEDDDNPLVPNGKLYIVFKDGSDEEFHDDILLKYHLSVRERRSRNEYIVAVTPASQNPIKCAIALQQEADVALAEPSFVSSVTFQSFTLPTDSMLKDQWHLRNTGVSDQWKGNVIKKGADAKVVDAWEWMQSLGNPNIRVAVIDDGFDTNHPDLKGDGTKVVAPWDFVSSTANVLPREEADDHGTSCAGVAVAADNGIGVLGAAPKSRLMPMRFLYIGDDEIEAYFKYLIDNKADVASCSWGMSNAGFKLSTRMYNAIQKAATEGRNGRGITICFAAGNEARPITGFATHPSVIAVTSSNSSDVFSADYSNYGPEASICAPSNGGTDEAPGAGITTDFMTQFANENGEKNYVHGFGGTSSACPLIAGICALVYSVNPTLTAKQVKQLLESTTDKIGSPQDYNANGHSIKFGYGRVNTLKAVQAAAKVSGSVLQGGGKITSMADAVAPPVAPPKPKPVVLDDRPVILNPDLDIPTATVNVAEVNMRSGPGTNFDILYKMTFGSVLDINEMRGKWVRTGTDIWVFGDNLKFPAGFVYPPNPAAPPVVTKPIVTPPVPAIPVLPKPTPVPPKPPTPALAPKIGTVAIDGLNVRQGPSTTTTALRKLALNTKVNILEASKDGWYRIGVNEWVFAKYIKI